MKNKSLLRLSMLFFLSNLIKYDVSKIKSISSNSYYKNLNDISNYLANTNQIIDIHILEKIYLTYRIK